MSQSNYFMNGPERVSLSSSPLPFLPRPLR